MICESGRGKRHRVAVAETVYIFTRFNRRVGELVACIPCARAMGKEARAAGAYVDARVAIGRPGAEVLIDYPALPKKGGASPK